MMSTPDDPDVFWWSDMLVVLEVTEKIHISLSQHPTVTWSNASMKLTEEPTSFMVFSGLLPHTPADWRCCLFQGRPRHCSRLDPLHLWQNKCGSVSCVSTPRQGSFGLWKSNINKCNLRKINTTLSLIWRCLQHKGGGTGAWLRRKHHFSEY